MRKERPIGKSFALNAVCLSLLESIELENLQQVPANAFLDGAVTAKDCAVTK
jgi:hypothetical protein